MTAQRVLPEASGSERSGSDAIMRCCATHYCGRDSAWVNVPGVETLIRPAVPTDAAGITMVLWISCWQAMPWLAQRHTEGEAFHWVEHVLLATATVWVAVQQGRVVGYVALARDVLEQLYVLPEYRGRGIGARLLAVAQEAAGDRLSLYAFSWNTGARRFYKRHGFTAVTENDGACNEEHEPDVWYEWCRAGLPAEAA